MSKKDQKGSKSATLQSTALVVLVGGSGSGQICIILPYMRPNTRPDLTYNINLASLHLQAVLWIGICKDPNWFGYPGSQFGFLLGMRIRSLIQKQGNWPTLINKPDFQEGLRTNADPQHSLKGQCHEIFCIWFFSWISFPKPLSIPLGPFRIFSKIRGDIRSSRLTTGINDTGDKIAAGINDTGGNQWDYNKAADTLKWTWRQKCIYSMLTLLYKGVPTKLLKFFWLKIFFICHRCQRHRWSTLSCEYLREFPKKFETVLLGYSGAGGNLMMKETRSEKISWHCPFKSSVADPDPPDPMLLGLPDPDPIVRGMDPDPDPSIIMQN